MREAWRLPRLIAAAPPDLRLLLVPPPPKLRQIFSGRFPIFRGVPQLELCFGADDAVRFHAELPLEPLNGVFRFIPEISVYLSIIIA